MSIRAAALRMAVFESSSPCSRALRGENILAKIARILTLSLFNRLAEAESLMWRALAIDERTYGPKHPSVAGCLNNLAQLLQATNRLAEAEPLMRRALAIDEQSFGPDHPNVARDLNNMWGSNSLEHLGHDLRYGSACCAGVPASRRSRCCRSLWESVQTRRHSRSSTRLC